MSIWLISVIPAHLVEYLTGADQILDHSPPFQALASPHLYSKCSLYFWNPKASGKKHVFSSTCDSMSEFVRSPWRVLTLIWHTPKSTKSHSKVGGRWSEAEITKGLLEMLPESRCLFHGWYWGSCLKKKKKHQYFSQLLSLHLFLLHSGFSPLASQCPSSHQLVFSEIDTAYREMSFFSPLRTRFRI